MNVLFLYTSELDPLKGGIERVTDVISRYLRTIGYTVYWIYWGNSNEKGWVFPSKEIYTIENINYLSKIVKEYKIEIVVNQAGFSKDTFRLVYSVKDSVPFKLITCLHNSLWGSVKYNTSHVLNKYLRKVGIEISDNLIVDTGVKCLYKLKWRRHYKNICKYSDALVLLSDKFKCELSEFIDIRPEYNIIAIPNPTSYKGFSVEELQKSEKEKILLYVGRIQNRQKRIDLLLKIWALVQEQCADWSLVIVGDGNSKEELKNLSRELRLKRVRWVDRCDPRPFYERASIFALTSSFEGFGIVLVEAMQYGVIPFAFNSYLSVTDIIDDRKNGILIPPFDIYIYASLLIKVMNSDDCRRRMRREAWVKAQGFTIDEVGRKWTDLFFRLLKLK